MEMRKMRIIGILQLAVISNTKGGEVVSEKF